MTPADLETIHSVITENSPTPIPHGCRDGVLSMIVEAPEREISGFKIFQTEFEQAACIMQEVIRLHPFRDGNKRTGLLAACVLLELNSIEIKLPSNASELARQVAAEHSKDHVPWLTNWFREHQV